MTESERSGTKKKGEKEDRIVYEYLFPPWPEWNDADVNAEKWDVGSAGGARSREKNKLTPTGSPPGFSNPLGHGELPKSLKVSKWVRPTEYTPDVAFTIYDGRVEPNADLVTPNQHLLRSKIIRAIISSVANLLRLAFRKPFPVELTSPTFVPTGDKIWQPWFHIYSHCKAGKGQTHDPTVNLEGKYIVRLCYMGAWRRITVDDYLPLDKTGRLLLPTTSSGTELWFIILSKALLLIGALTWTEESEVVDFNVTSCLTGWLNYNINCSGLSFRYIWPICQKLLMFDHEDETLRYDGVIKEKKSDHYCFTSPKVTHVVSEQNTLGQYEVLGSVTIFGNLIDLSDSPDAIEDLTPCHEHLIMITEAKSVKHNYDPGRPPTPLWKRFRWKEWALRTGQIQYKPMFEVKSVRVFSSLKKIIAPPIEMTPEVSSFGSDAEEILPMKLSETESKEDDVPAINKEQEKGTKKDKIKEKLPRKEADDKTKTDKRSNTSEEKKRKTPRMNLVKFEETPEQLDSIEPWCELEKILRFLSHLEVFYRPSCFANTLRITDVNQLTSKEKPATGKRQQIKQPEIDSNIRKCKNDRFYLYTDSVYCKKIVISLSVLPDYKISKYLEKLKYFSLGIALETSEQTLISEDDTVFHMIGEDYNWKSVEIGNEVFTLSTKGSTTVLLQLDEGISVVQIWLKVPSYYSLQILSQIPFLASNLEEVQEHLVGYSSSLIYYGEEIFNGFLNLFQINSESEEYSKALEDFKRQYLPMCLQCAEFKSRNDLTLAIDERFIEALLLTLQEEISNMEKLRNVILELKDIVKNPFFGCSLLEDIERKLEENNMASPETQRSSMERDKLSKEESNIQDFKREVKPKKSPKQPSKKPSKKDKSIVSNAAENSAAFYLNSSEKFIKILLKMCELDRTIVQHYPFGRDLDTMLVYSDYNGTEQAEITQDWLPLLRFVVNFHSKTPVISAFNFDSSIPSTTFRIINNDTLEEIPHNLMDVAPAYYARNNKGYTLLGYCYLKDLRTEASWKLRMLAEKYEDLPHSCTEQDMTNCTILQPPKLFFREVHGYYIPNKDNNICRCILKATNKNFVTLRLRLSDIMVECVMKIKKKSSDDFNVEYFGRGEIVIPVLKLDIGQNTESNETVEFEIEIYVSKRNGWSISDEEKSEVTVIKQRMHLAPPIQSSEEQKSPSKQRSARKVTPGTREKRVSILTNAPSWKLQLLAETDTSGQVNIEIDTRELEGILKLKASWEEADPGRRERAAKIREEYLLNCGENTISEINSILKQKSLNETEDFRTNQIFSQYFSQELRIDDYILLDECLEYREAERSKEFQEFNRLYNIFIEKRKSFLDEQSKRSAVIKNNFERERSISAEIMNISLKMREEYIDNQLSLMEQKVKQNEKNKTEPKKDLKKEKESAGEKEMKKMKKQKGKK